jgi:hypothetical protein
MKTTTSATSPEGHELLWLVAQYVVPAALALLPGRMDSPEARAMLLAIGLQESGFADRRQEGGGPARGFWQFEQGGVRDVVENPVSASHLFPLLRLLLYPASTTPAAVKALQAALADNDILAAVCARLLLYIDPRPMPSPQEAAKGWAIYLARWRPGAPRPAAWPACYALAWRTVKGLP